MGKLNNFGGITGNRYGNFEKSKKGSRGKKKSLLSNIPKVNKKSESIRVKQAIRFPIKMVLPLFHIPFPSSPLQNPINATTEKKVGNFWSSSPRKKRGGGGGRGAVLENFTARNSNFFSSSLCAQWKKRRRRKNPITQLFPP